MTQTNNSTTQPIHQASIGKRMLLGAAIALMLIIIFLLGVNNPKPEWGNLWMIKPLVIVPLAGALGGVFYYFVDHVLHGNGWKKVLVIIVSLVGYIVALWLGTVLGLNGTLWN